MHHTRRSFFKSAATIPFLFSVRCGKAKPDLPNIIVILADDMGYGDLRCLNPKSKIPTPNMDRLADEGIRFTDAHSGSAVCTPTRYGLLTGRYCWRTELKQGVLWGYSPLLIDTKRLTLASMLKSRGYRTAAVGKWHLGLGNEEKTDYSKSLSPGPNDLGFDMFFGIPASLDMIPYLYVENDHAVEQPTETVKEVRQGGLFWRGGPIAPNFKFEEVLPTLTQKAVTFIKDCAEQNQQPFFLYFPLTAPHTPWVPVDDFRGKSQAGLYGDFVAQVDWTIGQVLNKLDEYNIVDNTLIILTSDNGSDERYIGEQYNHEANYIYRGQKSDAWDGGHRVPFLVRWPEMVETNSQSKQLVCLTDIMATVADILDEPLPPDAGEDSISFLPVLKKGATGSSLRHSVVHHSVNGTFAIRDGEWKLIYCKGSGGWSLSEEKASQEAPWQLYNMMDDIRERKNLYHQKPETVSRLDALLQSLISKGKSR